MTYLEYNWVSHKNFIFTLIILKLSLQHSIEVMKIPKRSKLTYQVLLCLYIIGIFSLSSIPPSSIPDLKTQLPFDKLVHFTEYGIFGFLLFKVIQKSSRISLGWFTIPVIISAALLGAIDESYQRLTKRTPDVHDWLADVLGAVVCITLILLFEKHHKRRKRKSHWILFFQNVRKALFYESYN